MEHFDLVDGILNTKIISNLYMKNLRFVSHDPETAIANLKKVLVLSTHLCGEDIKFKHS